MGASNASTSKGPQSANQKDRYTVGDHDYWVHFWCGLVFGAGLGGWIALSAGDGLLSGLGIAAAVSLVVALCCGRWGDTAWKWILKVLSSF